MFWSVLSLLLTILAIVLVARLLIAFWAWLGRGKTVHETAYDERSDPKLQEAVDEIDRLQSIMKGSSEGGRRHLTFDELKEFVRCQHQIREEFLDHLDFGWYHVVMIFTVCSIFGLLLEEVWMLITMGLTESRAGLVWGPFSPLYGFGALILTFVCFYLRKNGAQLWQVFLTSMAMGGLLEQTTGWAMETYLGAISWDYIAGHIPGAITKWVAFPFLLLWGLLGCLWFTRIMPEILWRIGYATTRRKVVFVSLLGAYLALDITMTVACFNRRAERDVGIPPQDAFEAWVDDHFSDQFMSQRFGNMVFEEAAKNPPDTKSQDGGQRLPETAVA